MRLLLENRLKSEKRWFFGGICVFFSDKKDVGFFPNGECVCLKLSLERKMRICSS